MCAGVLTMEKGKEQFAASPQAARPPLFLAENEEAAAPVGVMAGVKEPASAPTATPAKPVRTPVATGGFVEETDEDEVMQLETPHPHPSSRNPHSGKETAPSPTVAPVVTEDADVSPDDVEQDDMHDEDLPDKCMHMNADDETDMMYTFASTRLGSVFKCESEDMGATRELSELSPGGAHL